jgi:organic hydroperoxide reductase OsmC/OhrA
MATVDAKRFEYAASVDRAGRIAAEDGAPVALDEPWTPEHLVLAGLGRCALTSLAYHARRASVELSANAEITGAVTRRDEDGRYAFVDIDVQLEIELDPEPVPEDLGALLGKAQRDCFVSASLRAEPRFRWTVNGRVVR